MAITMLFRMDRVGKIKEKNVLHTCFEMGNGSVKVKGKGRRGGCLNYFH